MLCLFQSGGLSHVDLFNDHPALHEHAGKEIPPSVKGNQRLTGMTSRQESYPVVPPLRDGKRCGRHGTWISDLLPHIQGIADDICIVKSLYTEAINHDPAITYMNTGNQQPGYASMGAWVSYGLGSENDDLPTFVAMVSQGTGKNPGPADLLPALGERLPPRLASGRGPPPRRQSGALSRQPPRRRSPAAPRSARRPRAAQRPAGPGARRSRDAGADPRLRDVLPDADVGARH